MDCKDLMVGDWVRFKENYPQKELQGKIAKVKGVRGRIDVRTQDGEYYESEHPDWLEPIPLTEEILVKNGFIFNKGYAVLQVSEDNYLDFYKHEHRLRKVWEGIDEWNNHAKVRDVTFVCQCYYVHEFQHALRLCGVEKSIIL